MKKKSIAFIILVIGILLIVLGICILVFRKNSFENKKQKELEETIIEKYTLFNKNIETFDEIRALYYSDINNKLLVENVSTSYKDWISFLDNYTSQVDKVEESSNYLKQECIEKEYSNQDILNTCKSFIIRYETVINYYTKDIISFNELLDKYRKELALTEESNIKDYNLKYNYVDIDLNGEFKGKD